VIHDGEALAEPDFDLDASGCLHFLWPALPEALIGKAERRWIEETAPKLPPIGGLGLELGLGPGEQGADLHQQLRSGGADSNILERYLSHEADGPLADPAVRTFLNDWARDLPGLRDDLHALYIEWDRPAAGARPAAPGIFLPVEPAGGSSGERLRRRRAAIRCSERIQPGMGEAAEAALDLLSRSIGYGASLNYVGFMLGRAGALRVNVRGVRRSDLAPLLEAIGWQGDLARAARHFERLVDLSDRVIVGLDFAPRLQPRIGFEAILDLPPPMEPRWPELFDYFVGEGLCTEAKRRSLEALPARFYPEVEGQKWPASWLVAALLGSKHLVPWVERRVSHLKLVVAGDGGVSAKAYVSAQHHWSRSAPPPSADRASSRQPADALLAAAADRAVGFLTAALGQDDLWRDFSMPGASDEWVTAFVGWALAGIADERACSAAQRGLEALLARQREDGGWGYNRHCASDSDSTAWALKFLQASRRAGPASEKATAFLLSHRLPDGGFSTYSAGAQLRLDDRPWNGPSQGWRSSHLCVAANAAGALPGLLTPLLRTGQSPDGAWRAYWWRTDVFATALAVDALVADESAAEARRRAVDWARRQAPLARSAFDRAWLARILIHGDLSDLDSARLILTGLVQEQGADGGWAAGAELLLPHPSRLDRDERLIPYLDLRRLFTTASVLAAVAASSRAGAR
jgi:hypothetical protein